MKGRLGLVALLAGLVGSVWLLHRLGPAFPTSALTEGPLEAALGAAARLAGLAIAYWLVASTLIYAMAVLAKLPLRWLTPLTWGPVRRLVEKAVASGLALTLSLPAGAGTVDPAYVPVAPITSAPSTTETIPDVGGVSDVVVKPGDNMWKLAEAHLERLTGEPVADQVIAPYWVKVIEANQDRIRSGNPDLIFPGEILVLPAWEPT